MIRKLIKYIGGWLFNPTKMRIAMVTAPENKIHELVKELAPHLADDKLALVFSDNPADWTVDFEWDDEFKNLAFFKLAPKFLFEAVEGNQFQYRCTEDAEDDLEDIEDREPAGQLDLYIDGFVRAHDFANNENNIELKFGIYCYAAHCVLLNEIPDARMWESIGVEEDKEDSKDEDNEFILLNYVEWEREFFEPSTDIFDDCETEEDVNAVLAKLGLS